MDDERFVFFGEPVRNVGERIVAHPGNLFSINPFQKTRRPTQRGEITHPPAKSAFWYRNEASSQAPVSSRHFSKDYQQSCA